MNSINQCTHTKELRIRHNPTTQQYYLAPQCRCIPQPQKPTATITEYPTLAKALAAYRRRTRRHYTDQ